MKSYTKEEIEEMIKKARFNMWKEINETVSLSKNDNKEYKIPKDTSEIFIDKLLAELGFDKKDFEYARGKTAYTY